MTVETLGKMDKARHLLPDPGPEVVGECLAEIWRLRKALAEIADLNFSRANVNLAARAAVRIACKALDG